MGLCFAQLLPDFEFASVAVPARAPAVDLSHDPASVAGQVAGPAATLPLGFGNLRVGSGVSETVRNSRVYVPPKGIEQCMILHFDDERV